VILARKGLKRGCRLVVNGNRRRVARQTGCVPDVMGKNRFSAAVREGIAQADRGELIDDDEVRIWLEQQESS
jgi:predicted transcriptional regulator